MTMGRRQQPQQFSWRLEMGWGSICSMHPKCWHVDRMDCRDMTWSHQFGHQYFCFALRIEDSWYDDNDRSKAYKGRLQKKSGKMWEFWKTGGGGLPKSHFFCNLTKCFLACQIHSEVLKHVSSTAVTPRAMLIIYHYLCDLFIILNGNSTVRVLYFHKTTFQWVLQGQSMIIICAEQENHWLSHLKSQQYFQNQKVSVN